MNCTIILELFSFEKVPLVHRFAANDQFMTNINHAKNYLTNWTAFIAATFVFDLENRQNSCRSRRPTVNWVSFDVIDMSRRWFVKGSRKLWWCKAHFCGRAMRKVRTREDTELICVIDRRAKERECRDIRFVAEKKARVFWKCATEMHWKSRFPDE